LETGKARGLLFTWRVAEAVAGAAGGALEAIPAAGKVVLATEATPVARLQVEPARRQHLRALWQHPHVAAGEAIVAALEVDRRALRATPVAGDNFPRGRTQQRRRLLGSELRGWGALGTAFRGAAAAAGGAGFGGADAGRLAAATGASAGRGFSPDGAAAAFSEGLGPPVRSCAIASLTSGATSSPSRVGDADGADAAPDGAVGVEAASGDGGTAATAPAALRAVALANPAASPARPIMGRIAAVITATPAAGARGVRDASRRMRGIQPAAPTKHCNTAAQHALERRDEKMITTNQQRLGKVRAAARDWGSLEEAYGRRLAALTHGFGRWHHAQGAPLHLRLPSMFRVQYMSPWWPRSAYGAREAS
jgi:hypothetical protein